LTTATTAPAQTDNHAPPLNLRDAWFAVGIGLFALTVYGLTLCPTVPPGDSGELVAAAHGLGVAHPPGYPLFTLLAAAADHAAPGWGNPAWRINLLNALFAALAAALVFTVARQLGCYRGPAALAATLYAFTPTVWLHALGTEVFALNTALSLTTTLFALRWFSARTKSAPQPARWQPTLTGLFAGLALSNHHTASLVLLALLTVALYLAIRYRTFRCQLPADLLAATIGFLLGLLPYLYLPLAAAHDAPVSWGTADTLGGFLQHLTRADYGSFQLVPGDVDTTNLHWYTHPALFVTRLFHQTFGVLPVLALAGLAAICLRRTIAGAAIALSLLTTGGLFLLLVNAPLEPALMQGVVARFHILPTAFAAVLAGLGLQHLTRPICAPHIRTTTQFTLAGAATLLLLITHYRTLDQSDNYVTHDLGANILNSLPDGALFMSRSDLVTNAVNYQRFVLKRRPDVTVVDQELLTYPWYAAALQRRAPDFTVPGQRYDGVHVLNIHIIDANRTHAPLLFFDFKETSYQARYTDEPYGLLRRIVPRDTPTPLPEQRALNTAIWNAFERRSLTWHPDPQSFEHEALGHYADTLFNLGWLHVQTGAPAEGAAFYKQALALRPNDWRLHRNLGAVLANDLKRPHRAADHLQRSLELNPNAPGAADLRAALPALRSAP
jgi:tetratricopeptide (TPR) repeat protein